jgi:hypothetical protein
VIWFRENYLASRTEGRVLSGNGDEVLAELCAAVDRRKSRLQLSFTFGAIIRLISLGKDGTLKAWTGIAQPHTECRTAGMMISFPARRQTALVSSGR